jgi:hypothetical protein
MFLFTLYDKIWENSWGRGPFFQKIIAPNLIKKLPNFYETQGAVACSQEFTTVPMKNMA